MRYLGISAFLRSRLWIWVKRTSVGLLLLFGVVLIVAALYEASLRRRSVSKYPPPGERVDIGGRKIHIDCRGAGTPTVVFEAGSDVLGSLSWSAVHNDIARVTRACAYDRAGIMWSDPKSGLQDGRTIASDLHAALKAAGERAPLVLVGHSLGAPLAMVYTASYPNDVVGLVLVDPGHPDQMRQIRSYPPMDAFMNSSQKSLWFASALSWTGLPRILLGDEGNKHQPTSVAKAAGAYVSTSLPAMLSVIETVDRTLAESATASPFGDRPLIVVSSGHVFDTNLLAQIGLSKSDIQNFTEDWRKFHREEASWSRQGELRIIPNTGHYIQFDQPQVVVSAVRDVVAKVRATKSHLEPAN